MMNVYAGRFLLFAYLSRSSSLFLSAQIDEVSHGSLLRIHVFNLYHSPPPFSFAVWVWVHPRDAARCTRKSKFSGRRSSTNSSARRYAHMPASEANVGSIIVRNGHFCSIQFTAYIWVWPTHLQFILALLFFNRFRESSICSSRLTYLYFPPPFFDLTCVSPLPPPPPHQPPDALASSIVRNLEQNEKALSTFSDMLLPWMNRACLFVAAAPCPFALCCLSTISSCLSNM